VRLFVCQKLVLLQCSINLSCFLLVKVVGNVALNLPGNPIFLYLFSIPNAKTTITWQGYLIMDS
jgi:hypothetical protein